MINAPKLPQSIIAKYAPRMPFGQGVWRRLQTRRLQTRRLHRSSGLDPPKVIST